MNDGLWDFLAITARRDERQLLPTAVVYDDGSNLTTNAWLGRLAGSSPAGREAAKRTSMSVEADYTLWPASLIY
jgi:hypothetical protein